MHAEVSSGAAQERGEEEGCKYQQIMNKKRHDKTTMNKEKVIGILEKK